MKFALTNQHHYTFHQNQYIEFEQLLDEKQLAELTTAIDNTLQLRLQGQNQSSATLFLAGRDLWKSNTTIKKYSCYMRFAAIAAELTNVKPLRIAYDQLLSSPPHLSHDGTFPWNFIDKPTSLQQWTSIQNIVGALILCLIPSEQQQTPLPSKPGNGIYLMPKLPLDLSFLKTSHNSSYLLIAYTEPKAVYYHRDNDPFSYIFKNNGYSTGDLLSTTTHPVIFH